MLGIRLLQKQTIGTLRQQITERKEPTNDTIHGQLVHDDDDGRKNIGCMSFQVTTLKVEASYSSEILQQFSDLIFFSVASND
jgi:hypothetical protein